jgi:hypothetical protein
VSTTAVQSAIGDQGVSAADSLHIILSACSGPNRGINGHFSVWIVGWMKDWFLEIVASDSEIPVQKFRRLSIQKWANPDTVSALGKWGSPSEIAVFRRAEISFRGAAAIASWAGGNQVKAFWIPPRSS